jgi:hypothetical protein
MHDGVSEAEFVQMRTARDATLEDAHADSALRCRSMCGRWKLPPAQDDGRTYIQLPINAFARMGSCPRSTAVINALCCSDWRWPRVCCSAH